MTLVRSRTNDSRRRCSTESVCWASVFGETNRIEGREAASQIASASTKSFLLLLTKGRTNCGEISLVSCPMLVSSRATKCEPAQASITTVQAGQLPKKRIICTRESFLRKISRPDTSWPCKWNVCLPRSMPTSASSLMMIASTIEHPAKRSPRRVWG
ncbi:hypothetical protein D9M68_722280 [compost metagenome]